MLWRLDTIREESRKGVFLEFTQKGFHLKQHNLGHGLWSKPAKVPVQVKLLRLLVHLASAAGEDRRRWEKRVEFLVPSCDLAQPWALHPSGWKIHSLSLACSISLSAFQIKKSFWKIVFNYVNIHLQKHKCVCNFQNERKKPGIQGLQVSPSMGFQYFSTLFFI